MKRMHDAGSLCASHRAARARSAERGSALLIVFVFAAMIAIMLYREMPVAAFEAQRQKEQLLVDRGHEYVRAIQLFYRRNRGQYPASIEQLEDTNRVRYLRHKYKDPLTGKDEWRLLHAGPGGMLIDSKVNPMGLTVMGTNGVPGTNTANGAAGTTANNANDPNAANATGANDGFAAAATGATGEGSAAAVMPPQRPPAVRVNGAGAAPTDPNAALPPDPGASLIPASNGQQGTPGAASNTTGTEGLTGPGGNGPGGSGFTQPGAAQAGANAAAANGQPQNPNVMQQLRSVLNAPNAPPGQGGAQGSNGQMLGGSLAGIASKMEGRGIKRINDQSNYAKWEFYYDPTKDTSSGLPGAAQQGGAQPGALQQGGIQTRTNQQNPAGGTGANGTQTPPQNGSEFPMSTTPPNSGQQAEPATSPPSDDNVTNPNNEMPPETEPTPDTNEPQPQ
jgi:hypothetical protein